MSRRDLDRLARRAALSDILKGLRQQRGLTSRRAAELLGLTLRSYERFEAGEGTIDLDRLFVFAQVADCDPIGLISAIHLNRPELALRCADNKLMLIHAHAYELFSRRLGDGVRRLEATSLISAFTRAFDELATEQEEKDERASAWMRQVAPPQED